MAKIDGGELLIRTLVKAGVKRIFTLHGGHIEPIYQSGVNHGIEILDVRHEAVAGHAAEGHARTTGEVGVAAVTAGPGFTNVVTALASAHLDGVPVLILAGSPPLRDAEHNVLQGGFDQVRVAAPIAKWAHQVTQTHQIPRIVAKALRVATSGRPGPVFIDLPCDILYGQVDEEAAVIPETLGVETAPRPSSAAIDAALQVLRSAERPAIMVGGGGFYSAAGRELRAFAETTGIPVFANSRGQGLLPGDHPLSGGNFATLGRLAQGETGGPDAVLMIGARFGMFTAGITYRVVPKAAKVIQVDIEPGEIGKIRDVEVGIYADCRETLAALLEAGAGARWPDRSAWQQAAREANAAHEREFADAFGLNPIHPYELAKSIVETIPDDAIIVADGGETFDWVETVARPKHPGSLLSVGYLGCLGTGFGWAIGAQKAHPSRRVVCVTGDGAVGFNIQDYDTMVRHRLPIVTIVFNNECWAMSLHAQDIMFGANRRIATELGRVNYHDVAIGFGCHGELVTDHEEIRPALKRALASNRPACLNVIVDKAAIAPFTLNLLGERRDEKEIILPYYENLVR